MTVAPDSEAHRRIRALAPRYRTFALIAHLREAHGLTEVTPERAPIAHALFTRHEMALASPKMAHQHGRKTPKPRRRRRTTGSPDAYARMCHIRTVDKATLRGR